MSTNEQAARAEAERLAVDGWLAQFHPPTPEQYAIAGGARWGHRAGWKAAESALLARLSDPDPALVEHLCELMHDAYERAAAGNGWETNPASRQPWAGVPIANQRTMRIAVVAGLAALAAHLTDHQVTAANCGGCCAWCGGTGTAYSELTSICEDCRGTGHTDDHDSVSVAAHLTDPTPTEDGDRHV